MYLCVLDAYGMIPCRTNQFWIYKYWKHYSNRTLLNFKPIYVMTCQDFIHNPHFLYNNSSNLKTFSFIAQLVTYFSAPVNSRLSVEQILTNEQAIERTKCQAIIIYDVETHIMCIHSCTHLYNSIVCVCLTIIMYSNCLQECIILHYIIASF